MKRSIILLTVLTILMASTTTVAAQEPDSNQADRKGGTLSQTILGAINGIIQNDKDPNNSPIDSENTEKDNLKEQPNTPPEANNERAQANSNNQESAQKRSARKGRNPQTGKEIKIPAKKVVKFKPGAELSDKIKMAGPGNSTDTDNLYMVELSETDGKKGLDAFIDTTTKPLLKLSDTNNDGRVDSVSIPGKSIEQGSYREGNEAKHEKKLWGQVSFDDLEMERGAKREEADYELGEEFTVKFGNSDISGYSVKVRPIAGSQNRVLVSTSGKEYSPPELDATAVGGDSAMARDDKDNNQMADTKGRTEYDDLTMSRGAKQGEKMMRDNSGGKTVGAGQVTEIVELTGDGGSKALKKGNRVALALDNCDQECIDRLTEVAAKQTGGDVPVQKISADGDMATESVTIAFDEMIRTEAIKPNSSGKVPTKTAGQPTYDDLEMERGVVFNGEDENGEEYFVHATLIDEIRDEDDVSFELREGRKGMNAVDVRRTDLRAPDKNGTKVATLKMETENGKDIDIVKEKKLVGSPDDGGPYWPVKDLGNPKLHDWFEDVRAGKADSGRKEIAVKIQDEEGQPVTQFNFVEKQLVEEPGTIRNGHVTIEMDGEQVGKIPVEELDLGGENMVDRHGPMKTGRFEIQLATGEDSENSTAMFTADGDSAMGQEEITIAYDKMKRAR